MLETTLLEIAAKVYFGLSLTEMEEAVWNATSYEDQQYCLDIVKQEYT